MTQLRGPPRTTERRCEAETVVWVVTIFEDHRSDLRRYDLVVYGTVVSTFLRNPTQIGEVTPALAGTLGGHALIGTWSEHSWAGPSATSSAGGR